MPDAWFISQFIDADVEYEVHSWLRKQSEDFYEAGIKKLIKTWDKCINVNDDYVNMLFKIYLCFSFFSIDFRNQLIELL